MNLGKRFDKVRIGRHAITKIIRKRSRRTAKGVIAEDRFCINKILIHDPGPLRRGRMTSSTIAFSIIAQIVAILAIIIILNHIFIILLKFIVFLVLFIFLLLPIVFLLLRINVRDVQDRSGGSGSHRIVKFPE